MSTKSISELNIEEIIEAAMQKHHSGQWDEAYNIYKQVLQKFQELQTQASQTQSNQEIRQKSLLLMLNLGELLQKQGKLTEASQVYQEALKINPDLAEAYNNLGNVLQEQGKLEAAINCYQQALKSKPDCFRVYNNLGNVLHAQGKLKAAINCYEQALKSKPDFASAHNNLGNALKTYDIEAAIKCYQQALKYQPNWADGHYNLGTALVEQHDLEAARVSFEQALKIEPNYTAARFGICMSYLPTIYSSVDEIEFKRNQYTLQLQNLAHYYNSVDSSKRALFSSAVGTIQPFYLTYQGLNDRHLQKIYGKMICQLMASRYPQFSQPIELPKVNNSKIRIGIVSGFFHDHSNWKIPIRGWVENLDRSEFELFGYHTSSKRDSVTVTAAKVFDKFVTRPLLFERWCELIQQDNLHILIFPEFGMDCMTLRLGCLRLAPIQMASWGHPETSGLPTIDYYLSSELMEPDNAQEHYTEKLVKLPNLSIYYTPYIVEPEAVSKQEIGIEEHEIMFWCCQSLYKYLPQHDNVFPLIAKELNCKFVFLAHHLSKKITEVFCQRLDCAFKEFKLNYQDYCVFVSHMGNNRFAGMTAIADVFLDSIGWSGCNSTLEAIAHNTPVVTLPYSLMRGRHSMAILKMMGIEETIAVSKENYVQIAVRLGQDAQYRQYISEQVAQNKHKLYGDLKPVRALEDFLLQVMNKTRRFGADTNIQQALQHQRAHRFADAEQLYLMVLSNQPNHPEALYGLGTLAIQMGQLEGAEQWLSAAAQIQLDVKTWFSLGNVRQTQGRLPEAIKAYQQAIALRPDSAPIYNNLGYCLQQQGKWEEAISCYQKALEVQPNCVEASVNLDNVLNLINTH